MSENPANTREGIISIKTIEKAAIPAVTPGRKWQSLFKALDGMKSEDALAVTLYNEAEAKLASSAVHRYKRRHMKTKDFVCTVVKSMLYVERIK